jgi:methionyl-tRNA formyltransferase
VGRLLEIEPVLIFDQKGFSASNVRIFQKRAQGKFPFKDLTPFLSRYPSVDVPDHNGVECVQFVRTQRIALLVNAGTPRIMKSALLGAISRGVLNVHPGILPKYRGSCCCEWAIYNDDPVGVTAHFMDEGLDSGPIILTRELTITQGQTYSDVRAALYRLAQEVCVQAVTAIFERDLTPSSLPPQPEASVFKPIPDELLEQVAAKLSRGEYRYTHA